MIECLCKKCLGYQGLRQYHVVSVKLRLRVELNRNGYGLDVIGEQLGHSDIKSTAYYVDSLGLDKVTEINATLVKARPKEERPTFQ